MSDKGFDPASWWERWIDRWLGAVMVVALSAILTVVGWTALQLVGMRDDVHDLKVAIPALQSRLDRVERHQDLLDELIYRIEPPEVK